LQQQAAEIDALGIAVVALAFQSAERARTYVERTGWPWPLVVDEECRVYREYGMDRGSTWAIWGPASWGTFLKLILKGRRLRPPAGDIYRRGGDVLVDPDGIVRLHHVGQTPADRPGVNELLEVVRSRSSTTA